MFKIFHDTHYLFRDQIKKLYIDYITKVGHTKFFNLEDLDKEIQLAYQEGLMMVAVDENDETQLTGALLVYPLEYKVGLNPELVEVCDKSHTPYIAEVIVSEKFSKMGLRRKLLTNTFIYLKELRFKEVFTSIWRKNIASYNFYKSAGFNYVNNMFKYKTHHENKTQFTVKNLYLKRGL
ncbi:MAG: GNAT family N-acetyltransferase [Pigmentiphaga sp.]|nr:GNAT family N-acetyltransferase [Pigmentiphaga sp.]